MWLFLQQQHVRRQPTQMLRCVVCQQVYLEEDTRGYMERSSRDLAELGPKKSRSWQRVCQLLSRKQDRIEPVKALTLLPGEVSMTQALAVIAHDTIRKLTVGPEQVPLHVVLPFVKSSLRSLGEQKRTLAVVKGLSRAQDLQSRERLTVCKKR